MYPAVVSPSARHPSFKQVSRPAAGISKIDQFPDNTLPSLPRFQGQGQPDICARERDRDTGTGLSWPPRVVHLPGIINFDPARAAVYRYRGHLETSPKQIGNTALAGSLVVNSVQLVEIVARWRIGHRGVT